VISLVEDSTNDDSVETLREKEEIYEDVRSATKKNNKE
jgi:hypothetical protein